MIYQNIKNIINTVTRAGYQILTANLFKNYAAVLKQIKYQAVRIYLAVFKGVKSKNIVMKQNNINLFARREFFSLGVHIKKFHRKKITIYRVQLPQ